MKDLLKKLLGESLEHEVTKHVEYVLLGFKPWVRIDDPILRECFQDELTNRVKAYPRILQAMGVENLPPVAVTADTPLDGQGYMVFEYALSDLQLGSFPRAIKNILLHFGLAMYLDIFDHELTQQLKALHAHRGLYALIDATVQTAFYAGLQGDAEKAHSVLKKASWQPSSNAQESSKVSGLGPIFDYILTQTAEPHQFLKVALSYYVVKKLGKNISKSSRHLNISRTTLHQHLEMAEPEKIEHLLGL